VKYLDPDGRLTDVGTKGGYQLPYPPQLGKNIYFFVFRDIRSYNITQDRDNPKNFYLDSGFLYNANTKELIYFPKLQTVANYPLTDSDDNPVDSCYEDTVAAGPFQLKVSTTTNVADGLAGIIINAITIDGRKIDSEGYTVNGHSSGRGLLHSNRGRGKTYDYNTPYSKQCIILPYEDNKKFFGVLSVWGVKDGGIVQGYIFNVVNTEENIHE